MFPQSNSAFNVSPQFGDKAGCSDVVTFASFLGSLES